MAEDTKNLTLVEQNLESENMQKAAGLLEQGVQLIPHDLLQPLHQAIEHKLLHPDVDERTKLILDFYLNHFQYKKTPAPGG